MSKCRLPKDEIEAGKKYLTFEGKGRIAERYKKFPHFRRRFRVLFHYSGGEMCCACCGEKNFEFLCVDHAFDNGAEHRKQLGTTPIVDWIIKNNYPPGFQVLCHNCNMSIGFYHYCPHIHEPDNYNYI